MDLMTVDIPCAQDSPESLLKKFATALETEYSRQSSSQKTNTSPKWSQLYPLVSQCKAFQNISITEHSHRKVLIEYVLQYIELVMSYLSFCEDCLEYRKQRQYAVLCFSFIPEIFEEFDFKNLFVKEATSKILDLFLYGTFSLVSKRELISTYNDLLNMSSKQVRVELSGNIKYYMYQLIDCLYTHGDYVIQSDVMETIYRLFGTEIKNDKESQDAIIPGSEELGKALVTDISLDRFDVDVRRWLNKLNENSEKSFSIACKKVVFGDYVCIPPEDFDTMWVDFNQKERIVSFYCKGSSDRSWNRVIMLSKDVKKTEVKRPLGSNETTVSFHLAKPCLCEELESQEIWNRTDKHLKLIINNEEKDKINKLITSVLPQVFGDTFSHTSAKIASKPKQVYKPLAIKISKRKSFVSDVSSLSTVSRSKGDETSVRSSRSLQESAKASTSKSERSSLFEVKYSKPISDTALSDNILEQSVTDFTRLSTDQISLLSSNHSDVFPACEPPTSPLTAAFRKISRGDTATEKISIASSSRSGAFSTRQPCLSPLSTAYLRQKEEQKVQDNIVTSSYEAERTVPSGIEILSGRCSGRSADFQKRSLAVGDAKFQASEVFSSSPIKISKQKNSQDTAESMFESAIASDESLSKDGNHLKDQRYQETDEFETAADYFEEDTQKKHKADSESTTKISKCIHQVEIPHIDQKVPDSPSDKDSEIIITKKRLETFIDSNKCETQKELAHSKVRQTNAENPTNGLDVRRSTRLQDRTTKKTECERVEDVESENDIEIARRGHKNVLKISKIVEIQKEDLPKEIATESFSLVVKSTLQNEENILYYTQGKDQMLLPNNEHNLKGVVISERRGHKNVSKISKITEIQKEGLPKVMKDEMVLPNNEQNLKDVLISDSQETKANETEGKVTSFSQENDTNVATEEIENIFGAETQKNEFYIVPAQVTQECDSEDIFSRETQENRVLSVDKDQNTEHLTDLSLAVNIGISENQSSDDVRGIERELLKQKENITIKNSNAVENIIRKETEQSHLNKSPRLMEENKENIIDLTEEDEDIEDISQSLKKTIHPIKTELLFNTQELTVILEDIYQPDKPLKEVSNQEDKKIPNIQKGIQPLPNHIDVIKEKVTKKKKKPRKLIKTGKKHFNIDDIKEISVRDDIGDTEKTSNTEEVNKEKTFQETDLEPSNNKVKEIKIIIQKGIPEIFTAVDNNSTVEKIGITTERKEKEASLEIDLEQRNKEPNENKIISSKVNNDSALMKTIKQNAIIDADSDSDEQLAPEINIENVDYIQMFNELKRTEDESRSSGFVLKKPARPLLPSQEVEEKSPSRQLVKNITVSDKVDVAEELAENINDNDKVDVAEELVENINDSDKVDDAEENGLPEKPKRNSKISNVARKKKKGKAKKEGNNKITKTQKESNSYNAAKERNVVQENIRLKSDPTNGEENLETEHEQQKQEQKEEILNQTKSKDIDNANVKTIVSEYFANLEKENLAGEADHNKKALSDSSPPCSPPLPIPVVAQVHSSAHNNHKGKEPTPLAKSLSQELKELANEVNVSIGKKNDTLPQKSLVNDLDLIEECSTALKRTRSQEKTKKHLQKAEINQTPRENSPIFTRTRSQERIRSQVREDDFYEISEENARAVTRASRKGKVKRKLPAPDCSNVGNKSKRLFDPENLDYLDEVMTGFDNHESSDDDTPIAMSKADFKKLPKKKQIQVKKNKTKTPEQKNKTPMEKTPKQKTEKSLRESTGTKRRSTKSKRKEFTLSTTNFRGLNALFNDACKGLFDITPSRYGTGRDFNNKLTWDRPMDIAVRSAPTRKSSSDEEIDVLPTGKKTTPELCKIGTSNTPSSPESPTLLIEHFNKTAEAPKKKINILQNIVIAPKRHLPPSSKTSPRKKRRTRDEEEIPLPMLDDNMEIGANCVPNSDSDVQKLPGVFYEEFAYFIEFVGRTVRKPDSKAVQWLTNVFEESRKFDN